MDGSKSFCADDTELSPDEIDMLSILPDDLLTPTDSLEQYLFNLDFPPTSTDLDLFELAVNSNPNLYDHALSIDNNPVVQYGGVLNNQLPTRTDDDITEQPVADDNSQSSTGGARPASGNVNALLVTDPAVQTRLSSTDVDTLIREGGFVNGYHVLPRPRFNSVSLRRSMNLREINSTDLASYHTRLHNLLSEIVGFAREIGSEAPVINMTMSAPALQTPVSGVLTSGNDYSVDLLMEQFEKVLQSNDRLLSDDVVEIDATVAMNRQGGGRRKLTDLAVHQVIKKKKSTLFCPINLSNNLCFSICLARFLNPQLPENELEKLATSIQNAVGFSIHNPIALSDIAVFERALGIKIVVFHRSNAMILESYKTCDEPHPKTAFLYLDNNHYYMILSLTSFLGSQYVCQFCYKSYINPRTHRCKHACNICFDVDCHRFPKRTIHCPDCSRYCKSSYCFEMHKKNSPPGQEYPACDIIKYCKLCCKRYDVKQGDKATNHKCSPDKCVHCREELADGGVHQCFIQPLVAKEKCEKYIFYDFETRYENGRHVANFVCAITFKGQKFTAEGTDCIAKLIARFRQPRYNGYCFIAHYASRFDAFLILEYFCNAGIGIEIIMQGCKIIFMYDESFAQRYIDSYAFFPMALAKMPAALDLETMTGKTYFPHMFNIAANANYVGPYPDKKFYNYDNMSDKDREKFDAWYSTVQGERFDFRQELYTYGVNDVVLLREGCMKYREAFIECAKLDPFAFTTIASCSMGVFKTHYLDRNTLALTHNKAYIRQNKCYSNGSIEWLEYVKKSRKADVHHAVNHGEVSIGKYFLDGYYEQDGVRHGLEYAGCVFHGHCCRFEPHQTHPLSGVPYGVLRRQFDDKVEILQNAYGLQIEVLWECEWNAMKKTDPSVIEFMANYSAPERLRPREALFGGRTNAYKLYHKVSGDEKIRYLDFTSLYPYCQATKSYPIEHPQIIFNDFEPIENYYGLIKATVYPPRKLLHPVLPYRCQGKLMFPLCRTCAHDQNQTTSCTHTNEERALSGCWVSIELLKAVEKGYVVAKIDEVWHFPQRSDTLFDGYVKTFLRLKQQASGYPSNVVTDAEKETYIREYFEKEGIQLDPEKIKYNAAQRAITKLILNSLWGRFSLRPNLPQTTLVSDPEVFTRIVFGNTDTLSYFSFVSDDVALVQHKPLKDDVCKARDVNVFIGAFTTAHARLELYALMDRLGDRLLYSDTDSVIFVSRPGDWEPPLGDHLGELTSEIEYDDFITEFCSSGPKSYGFRTCKGTVCMKAKGITLNAKNSQTIRLESLIGLVDSYVTSPNSGEYILAQTENIVRNKKTLTLHNKSVVKRFKVVYNKRRLLPDYTTLPYGY
ncbi:uncharacterized protein [Pseudorasbora parva]|uniref:uncharacterized protein n=1 Tax=Pseudorasbora parva TaxID=51549 RepID=UPI00351F2DFC